MHLTGAPYKKNDYICIMRKIILIFCLSLFLIGCEKTYTCEIYTPGLEGYNYYEFKGTHKEMKEFENSPIYPGQTVNCH